MSNIAERAFAAREEAEDEDSDDEDGDESDEAPARTALREAWEASKKNDFDAFADAIESLIDIKVADR